MTSQQLKRKLQKILIDLQEFADERYLDPDSSNGVQNVIEKLDYIESNIYSTKV